MRELEPRLDAEAITHKWQSVIEGGQQLTDADLFNLGSELIRVRNPKWPQTADIELSSPSGGVFIGHLPEDSKTLETIWINIENSKRKFFYDVCRNNDLYYVFSIDYEKGDNVSISLSQEDRLKIVRTLLAANQFTPLKRKVAVT